MSKLITLIVILTTSQISVSTSTPEVALKNLVAQAQITAYSIKAPTTFNIQYKLVDVMPESDMTAVCNQAMKVVKVSRNWFNQNDDVSKLALIAHEMLHCEYSIEHQESGIMHAETEVMTEDAHHMNLKDLLQEVL